VLAYYIYFKRILADTIYGTEISKVTKQIDINNDGINEAIILSQFKKDGKNIFVIDYESKVSDSQLELEGFESGVDFCPDPFPKISKDKRIICTYGFVGAHSENIQLFQILNNKLEVLKIVTQESKLINISSDVPKFGFEDLNHNGNLYFYVEDRNYNLDPTLDSWRSYYYFRDGEFIFDHKIALQGGIETSNQQGKIN
jgi:hypothetical protein